MLERRLRIYAVVDKIGTPSGMDPGENVLPSRRRCQGTTKLGFIAIGRLVQIDMDEKCNVKRPPTSPTSATASCAGPSARKLRLGSIALIIPSVDPFICPRAYASVTTTKLILPSKACASRSRNSIAPITPLVSYPCTPPVMRAVGRSGSKRLVQR